MQEKKEVCYVNKNENDNENPFKTNITNIAMRIEGSGVPKQPWG